MSHFTKLAGGQITSAEAFIKACRALGLTEVRRETDTKDYYGKVIRADVAVRAGQYDLALVRAANGKYDLVADFWGVRMELMKDQRGTFHSDQELQDRLLRDTTRHAIVDRYAREGFRATVTEDAEKNLNIELVRA